MYKMIEAQDFFSLTQVTHQVSITVCTRTQFCRFLTAFSVLPTPPHNSSKGFTWLCGYNPNSLIWSKDLYHLATASTQAAYPILYAPITLTFS